jgi:Helix-loop-helix DNA-binding domain
MHLDYQQGNMLENASYDISNEFPLPQFNDLRARDTSGRGSVSGAPSARYDSNQQSPFFPPDLYGDFPSECLGCEVGSTEQNPTSTVQALDNSMIVPGLARDEIPVTNPTRSHRRPKARSRRPKAFARTESGSFASPDQLQQSLNARGPRPTLDAAINKALANTAHSLVERRYREGLNVKLQQLETALLRVQQPPTDQEAQNNQQCDKDGPGSGLARRTKSDVLYDTVSYIHQSEVDLRHLADEVSRLKYRMQLLERLVKCEDCPLVKHMSRMRLNAR